MDGIITTFSVVAGSFGANIDTYVINMRLGNFIGEGLSMLLGDYLISKKFIELSMV